MSRKAAAAAPLAGGDPPHDDATPRATLIESLRAFGYSLQTAIADLIDNSIAAGARNVWLDAEWAGRDSRITILDDGQGMTGQELVDAMRPGSRSPLDDRVAGDLGRFGLGLKTASLSQCRCLTVASKCRGAEVAVRRWDLEFVERSRQWWILREPTTQGELEVERLHRSAHGTLVVWEQLDRAIGWAEDADPGELKRHFNHAVSQVVKPHLAMVFHRFIDGDAAKLNIHINGTKLEAWDPFSKHPARQALPAEPISIRPGEVIRLKPFVMPHKDKLTSAQHRAMSGPAGWNAQQGFYVYRKKRLLVAGSWLGLAFTKDEHFKLARIQLDMPESSDADWSIDVKKSTASPPPAIRSALERVARLAREHAENVYRHRAGKSTRRRSEDIVRIWEEISKNGKRGYRIKRDHPLVSNALAVPKEHQPAIEALLRVIEETLPIDRIWLDESQKSESTSAPFSGVSEHELREILAQAYEGLRQQGYPPAAARQRLDQFEVFCQFPHFIAALKD